MDPTRLTELTASYLDHSLAADEMAELQTALLASPEARAGFWDAVEWQALFRQWGAQEAGREAAQRQPLPRLLPRPASAKVVPFPRPNWVARIAALAALLAVGWFAYPQLFPPRVAVLAQTAEAVWAGPGPAVGENLKPRTLRLRSGVAVLTFARGARVVLEGPAELALVSDNEGRLISGRLRAHVPESAHGFTIRTPQFAAVDLGTEFGCSVSAKGASELHVFDGAVQLASAKMPAATLRENQAVRLDRGVTTALPARPEAFLDDDELARRELLRRGDRLGAWQLASRALGAHPAALAHLDFTRESDAAKALTNRARHATTNPAALLRGPLWVDGRWPGKSALAFAQPQDRLEFAVPGTHSALTLMAWVRVDDLRERRHLLATAGSLQPGGVEWYLNDNGTLAFSVHKPADDDPTRGWSYALSQPVLHAHLGQWVHLASVAEGPAGNVRHYLNGQFIGGEQLKFTVPFRLGACEIGNVVAPDGQRVPARHFVGRMDEFTILSTALRPADIRHWFETGEPPPTK